MRTTRVRARFLGVLSGFFLLLPPPTLRVAATITLDKNGFPTISGGQISGPGLPAPIPLGNDGAAVVLTNLQPGATYQVDFFHNGGLGGSDFSFTVNAAGTGLESVSAGGSLHAMVIGFRPGDSRLVLNTHRITYNTNRGQTGPYYLVGVTGPGTITTDEPVTLTVIPGLIRVDNLHNMGQGNEDFSFLVNSDGTTSILTGALPDPDYVPGVSNPHHVLLMNADGTGTWVFTNSPSYEEYAVCSGASVSPNAVEVRFLIETSTNLPRVFLHQSFPLRNATQYVRPSVALPFVYAFDLTLAPGNVGVFCPAFGSNTVRRSTAMQSAGADIGTPGPPLQDTTSPNDFLFTPRLRCRPLAGASATNAVFYWQNTDGNSNAVSAFVEGVLDDGTPIQMHITATIAERLDGSR